MNGEIIINHPGQKRVKADYLVLRTLEAKGGNIQFDELKQAVDDVIDSLTVKSPIHFKPTSGPVKLQSRSFNEAIHRCRDSHFIVQDDRNMRITEEGLAFISNGKYKKAVAVREFKKEVDEVVQQLFES